MNKETTVQCIYKQTIRVFNIEVSVKTECWCNVRSVKVGHKCANSVCPLLGLIQKQQSKSIAGIRAEVGNIKTSIFSNKKTPGRVKSRKRRIKKLKLYVGLGLEK